jgi:hypothetical protein
LSSEHTKLEDLSDEEQNLRRQFDNSDIYKYTATIGNWAADRKILEFKMCLRDRAVAWFEGLIEERLDVNDWDVIKAEFLELTSPSTPPKTTCANFTDLNQKSE